MTPQPAPSAQRSLHAQREAARRIRERATGRTCGTLTANERRAVYLLESGRAEQYAAEYPTGEVEP